MAEYDPNNLYPVVTTPDGAPPPPPTEPEVEERNLDEYSKPAGVWDKKAFDDYLRLS
ncbi:hypothetical protein LCGC14_2622980, partial [marine sediment metagenome]